MFTIPDREYYVLVRGSDPVGPLSLELTGD